MKDRILCIPNWERIKESERGIDSEATLGDYVARVYGSESDHGDEWDAIIFDKKTGEVIYTHTCPVGAYFGYDLHEILKRGVAGGFEALEMRWNKGRRRHEARILAIDIGGSAVKAALFDTQGRTEKLADWEHDYNTRTTEHSLEQLEHCINLFFRGDISAAGIGIAGLVATDNTLYRSTVLGSLVGTNLPRFLKDRIQVPFTTVDNDSDCGGIGVHNYLAEKGKHEALLYLALGSGLGSALISEKGEIMNYVRFEPGHEFSEEDNPVLNDVGLRMTMPESEIAEAIPTPRFTPAKILGRLLGEGYSIKDKGWRLGSLASARGVGSIFRAICDFDSRDDAWTIAEFARDDKARWQWEALCSYNLMGNFLGYAIARAQELTMEKLGRRVNVYLGGQITESFELFRKGMQERLHQEGLDNLKVQTCHDIPSGNPNLYGAYCRARLKSLLYLP